MKKYLYITLLIVPSLNHAELLFPENGQELNYIYVLFDWNQEPNSEFYNIQISNSESFDDIILDTHEETTLYIEKDTLVWENIYYWRVRPIYSDDSWWERAPGRIGGFEIR